MVQDSADVTAECEYEVVCNLSNGVMNDLEWPLTKVTIIFKHECLITVHFRDKVTIGR